MAHKTLYVGSYPYSSAIDGETVKKWTNKGKWNMAKRDLEKVNVRGRDIVFPYSRQSVRIMSFVIQNC